MSKASRRLEKVVVWGGGGLLCLLAIGVCSLPILLDDGTPSSQSRSRQYTPNVSDGEFDHAYNQFRNNGMGEEESGAAARAVSSFLDKQRAARAAEADRQRLAFFNTCWFLERFCHEEVVVVGG